MHDAGGTGPVFRGTVKCDRSGCGWQAEDVAVADYTDRYCPWCGTRLLDETDLGFLALAQAALSAGLISQDSQDGPLIVIDTGRRSRVDA